LELQQRFDKEGVGFLQDWLFQLDPVYYNQVDLQNPVRLMRAIEVCLVSGKTYSSQRTTPKKQRPFRVIRLGLCMPRPQLADRISFRVTKMMEMGFPEEARQLHAYRGIVPLKTIGYPELFDVLEGKATLESAISLIAVNTRRYAKKQMTWLQAQKDITWFHPVQTECIKRFLLRIRTL
jgi:tRNA dimethylallyltransferase